MAKKNYATLLTERQAQKLSGRIIDETQADARDRSKWDEKAERWHKLYACEAQKRVLPMEGAANVVVPIVTDAVNQWHSRFYATLYDQVNPEFAKVLAVELGDIESATRATKFLNWRVLVSMQEFEPQTDRLGLALGEQGIAFSKVYRDQRYKRPRKLFVPGSDMFVPYGTEPLMLDEAPRLTQRMFRHRQNIERAIQTEQYADIGPKISAASGAASGGGGAVAEIVESLTRSASDEIHGFEDTESGLGAPASGTLVLLERHETCDLSKELGDGLNDELKGRKHWTILVESTTGKVLHMGTRDLPGRGGEDDAPGFCQFTDYHLIPNPYGFYSFGFGHNLEAVNDIANTVFNQTIDAGRISNQPFVFHTPLAGFRKKTVRLDRPGVGVMVEDVNQIRLEKMPGLDQSLFMILGNLDRYARDIATNPVEMSGRVQQGVREPTARGQQGRIEQALVSYGSLMRRALGSQSRELQKILELDAQFMGETEAFRVVGEVHNSFGKVYKRDLAKRLDVYAAAEPRFSSRAEARSEALDILSTVANLPTVAATPAGQQLINASLKKALKTYGAGELAGLVPETPAPPMNPEVEHVAWLEGRVPPVSEMEDQQEHIADHEAFLAEHRDKLDEDTQVAVRRHLERTYLIMAALTAMKMEQMQQGADAAVNAAETATEPTPQGGPIG